MEKDDNEILVECFKSTHLAGDMLDQMFDANGKPHEMPSREALERLRRLNKVLTDAWRAASYLEYVARQITRR
jgi:hypothetical protein